MQLPIVFCIFVYLLFKMSLENPLENPLVSNHAAPPRNEAAFRFVDEKLKGWNRLKTILTIFVFFAALGYTEVSSVYNLTEQTVSCCFLKSNTSSSWTNCTVAYCVTSGFVHDNGGLLFKKDASTYVWFYLGTFVVTIGMMELNYMELEKTSQSALRLIPYGLYVGFHKFIYLATIFVLVILLLLLAYIRISAQNEMQAIHLYTKIPGQVVHLNFGKIGKGVVTDSSEPLDPSFSLGLFLNCALLTFTAYHGYLMTMQGYVFDFYSSQLTVKELMKHPELLVHLSTLRKIESTDLVKAMQRLLHLKMDDDLGKINTMDKDQLDQLVAELLPMSVAMDVQR